MPAESFLEIDYEDLVSNREEVSRKMIDLLGLEWSDSCLFPEQNPRPVSTPSQWQVRQPVYNSSVGRWQRYAPFLGHLIEQWKIE